MMSQKKNIMISFKIYHYFIPKENTSNDFSILLDRFPINTLFRFKRIIY